MNSLVFSSLLRAPGVRAGMRVRNLNVNVSFYLTRSPQPHQPLHRRRYQYQTQVCLQNGSVKIFGFNFRGFNGYGNGAVFRCLEFSTKSHFSERDQDVAEQSEKQGVRTKSPSSKDATTIKTANTKSSASMTVYENHRPNHFRLLSLFAIGQSTYWMFMALDNYFLAPATRIETAAAAQSDSLVLAFYTHPFWSVFGLGFTACLWGAVYAYSSHYISQIDLYGSQGMRLRTHSLFGGKSEPIILSDRKQFNFGTSPPKDADSYLLLNVQKHQMNYLIDRKSECFFPNGNIDLGNIESEFENMSDEQLETLKRKKKEVELVKRFGQHWSYSANRNNSSCLGKDATDENQEELKPLIDSPKFKRRKKRLPRKRC